jgi:hypothetical protein
VCLLRRDIKYTFLDFSVSEIDRTALIAII